MSSVESMLAAARSGDRDRVAALLDDHPDLATASNMFGSQPIHAAYFAGHHAIVDLLIQRGASMDVFVAAELGMLERVRAEVEKLPDIVHEFRSQGGTPLHGACYWGQPAVAAFLLDRGADANVSTRDGFLQIRPLGCAVATPDVPNPSDREQTVLELVRLLLNHGADVNGRRRDGLTALHSAAHRGHLRVIDVLLQHGADRSIVGSEGTHTGETAQDMADRQGHKKAADLLRP